MIHRHDYKTIAFRCEMRARRYYDAAWEGRSSHDVKEPELAAGRFWMRVAVRAHARAACAPRRVWR